MSLNYQGFYIKEEPQDKNEILVDLNNGVPIHIKLEDDTVLDDNPEFVTYTANTDEFVGSAATFNNGYGLVKHDILVENAYTKGKDDNICFNKSNAEYESNETISDMFENSSPNDNTNLDKEIPQVDINIESNSDMAFDDNYSSSDDGEYTCKVCKLQFLDDFDLQRHFKSRRIQEKSYKCCGCNKLFRDNTQLNVHSRKHTGEQPYSCKICEKRFSVNGNLSKHMRIHTGERKYECDTCERKFTQFAHLEDHMKTHSGDRPFVCDFCNSAFKTKARLRKHRKSHEDDTITKRSVNCPVCLKMLKSTKQLLSHMETHDTGSTKPFPCNICGKSYKNLFYLNFHLKGHVGIRDFKCNLCDKAFANASHLRRHTNSHTGIRPYNCTLCLRAFPSQQNLKRHMMTHTGEKPYSCQVCGRGFLTLENLNRHNRTHTGEKPFPCDICGKFFAHSTTAKEHQRVHTGDKPFRCSLCDKRFSLNKALYKHTRERHPEYFPEFKRINDLPPNMKRAREKLKREIAFKQETDVQDVLPLDVSNQINTEVIPGEHHVKRAREKLKRKVAFKEETDVKDILPLDVPNQIKTEVIPEFLSEYKRIKDLPPNIKRAKKKLKKEIVSNEDADVKNILPLVVANQSNTEVVNGVEKEEKCEITEEHLVANGQGNAQISFIKVEKQDFDYS